MGLFNRKRDEEGTRRVSALEASADRAIEALGEQIAVLTGELEGLEREKKVRAELEAKERELKDAKDELERTKTEARRADEEIEHKLKLHEKQMEHEREMAVKEAKIAVREEELKATTSRLEEMAAFQRESMEREQGATRRVLGQVLDNMPSVTIDRKIRETRDGSFEPTQRPQIEAGDLPSRGDESDVVDAE